MGLGLVLAAIVLSLLVSSAVEVGKSFSSFGSIQAVIALLDRALLVLLIVEVLYTVQVSFREHALAPEPFLLVGLISAIRRVLLITAQLGEGKGGASGGAGGGGNPQELVLELAVLAALVLAIAVSLHLVKRNGGVKAERG